MLLYGIRLMNSLRRKEDGQDLLEYALLVALIALVSVTAVGLAGTAVQEIFGEIAGEIGTANP
jgi:pilus assembly protein Flp/PilA